MCEKLSTGQSFVVQAERDTTKKNQYANLYSARVTSLYILVDMLEKAQAFEQSVKQRRLCSSGERALTRSRNSVCSSNYLSLMRCRLHGLVAVLLRLSTWTIQNEHKRAAERFA